MVVDDYGKGQRPSGASGCNISREAADCGDVSGLGADVFSVEDAFEAFSQGAIFAGHRKRVKISHGRIVMIHILQQTDNGGGLDEVHVGQAGAIMHNKVIGSDSERIEPGRSDLDAGVEGTPVITGDSDCF